MRWDLWDQYEMRSIYEINKWDQWNLDWDDILVAPKRYRRESPPFHHSSDMIQRPSQEWQNEDEVDGGD